MKQITRESTWDYNTLDESGLQDGGTRTVETIETWEWSPELGRYELVYLAEKETGEYIPFNENDYIRDGCIVPPAGKETHEVYGHGKCPREYIENGQKKLNSSHSDCYQCDWLSECSDPVAMIINKQK